MSYNTCVLYELSQYQQKKVADPFVYYGSFIFSVYNPCLQAFWNIHHPTKQLLSECSRILHYFLSNFTFWKFEFLIYMSLEI